MGSVCSIVPGKVETGQVSTPSVEVRLNNAERLQIEDYMRRNGFESLSDLNAAMTRIFKPKGEYDIDVAAAMRSKLFSQDELKRLNHNKVATLLAKIDAQLSVEDFAVEPSVQETYYKHGTNKDIFGSKEKVSQEEIDQEITNTITGFTTKGELLNKLRSLPYEGIADRFERDAAYAKRLMDRVSNFKRVPVLTIRGNELTDVNSYHYTNIKNNMIADANTEALRADLRTLVAIEDDMWHNNHDDISQILKEVEEQMIEYGIDAIGLSDKVHFKADVINLIGNVIDVLEVPSVDNMEAVAESFEALIPQPPNVNIRTVDPKYSGLNIVELHTRMSEGALYNDYGLIKVGDNLYHNVDQSAAVEPVIEAIYKKVLDGEIVLPAEYVTYENLQNKEEVLPSIRNFVESRKTPDNVNNRTLYSAYQIAFDHTPIQSKVNDAKFLGTITTPTDYLTSGFVLDFNRYVLTEKLKNSPIYRSKLSKFRITDKDITLNGKLDSIKGIEFETELSDYFALHRDSNTKHLITTPQVEMSEDMVAINFPETVNEFEGTAIKDSGYLVTDPNLDNYIKLDGILYRKALSTEGLELYAKVNTPADAIYYTNSNNFSFDKTQAKGVLNSYRSLKQSGISKESLAELDNKKNKNIEDYSRILDSGLKILPLYTEAQGKEITNRIDNCE